MSILSMITLGSSIGEMILNLILAGVLWILANYCYQLVTKINTVHEFTLTHAERHKSLEHEIARIDGDVKALEGDLKKQIEGLEEKLDDFMSEFRNTHKS